MSTNSKKVTKGLKKDAAKEKVDVQAKLKEFYEVTKEKLLKMKNEVEEAEKEHLIQKELNDKKNLEYKETLIQIEQLDIRIKGMNEKIHVAERAKANLEKQVKEMSNDIESSGSDLNHLKEATERKVKTVKEEAESINLVKENQVKTIQDRIDAEKVKKEELKERIKDIENRIKSIKSDLEENHSIEGKKNEALLKDTAEITKFLSEL